MDTNATEWHEMKKCVIELNVFIFCCRSHRQTPTSKIQSCHLLCAKDRVCIRVIVYGGDDAVVCRFDGCVFVFFVSDGLFFLIAIINRCAFNCLVVACYYI